MAVALMAMAPLASSAIGIVIVALTGAMTSGAVITGMTTVLPLASWSCLIGAVASGHATTGTEAAMCLRHIVDTAMSWETGECTAWRRRQEATSGSNTEVTICSSPLGPD